MYAYVCLDMCVYACVLYVCACVCIWVLVHVCMCACTHVCVCMYACICVHASVLCVCLSLYMDMIAQSQSVVYKEMYVCVYCFGMLFKQNKLLFKLAALIICIHTHIPMPSHMQTCTHVNACSYGVYQTPIFLVQHNIVS